MTNGLDVVVVDDKVLITDLFESYFQLSNMNVNLYTFNDPYKALEFVKNNDHIDVLITDYKMPGINGIQLLEATSTDTTRILISGYVSSIAVEKLADLNAIFFEKPVPMKELGKILHEKETENQS
jgi:DNA-binding NtrC family response regulator